MKKTFILALAALMSVTATGMAQKMSPDTELLLLKRSLSGSTDKRVKALSTDMTRAMDKLPETVGVSITVAGPWVADDLRAAGCTVNTVLETIITADVSLELLPQISKLDGVEYIEVGKPIQLKNANTRRRVKANEVHNANHPGRGDLKGTYRGEGVIIGMIDIGFEYNHMSFRSYDDGEKLRVSRVWNQTARGISPAGYNYGAEYTTPDQIKAARTDYDEFHGTHTTTIAAGSPKGSIYYGMAPEAELVLVSGDLADDSHIIDAVRYIFDYAESQGKPCVINMSLGSHYGPHDGTSAIDRAVSEMTGPGRIVVGSAGNEAGVNIHCSKEFTATDKTLKTMMAYTKGYQQSTVTYIWGTPGSDFTVEVALVDPTRKGRIVKTTGEISLNSSTNYYFLDEGTVTDVTVLVSPVVVSESGSPQITIESTVEGLASNRKEAIIVHGQEGATVHMWNAVNNHYFVSGGLSDFTEGDDLYTVGEIGGVGPGVISVGSYDSDSTLLLNSQALLPVYQMMTDMGQKFETGARSSFSSRGPSADGRMKPEVMAPGNVIISGYNSYYTGGALAAEYIEPVTDSDGNSYFFEISMGTSQAAPVVTGAVALWLEANPALTPEEIRGVLSRTCDRDQFTTNEPNNDYGYGKINILAGILDVLHNVSAIEDVTMPEGERTLVWADPSNQTLCCVAPGAAVATVYTVSGALVGSYEIASETRTIDTSSWAKGLYIVNVAAQGINESHKVVVR